LLPADLCHSAKSSGAYIEAGPTLNALTLVYYMDHSFITSDGISGTTPQTYEAALALLRDDIKGDKAFAYPGRTSFLIDMCFVFLTEVLDSGQYRVRRCSAQGTK